MHDSDAPRIRPAAGGAGAPWWRLPSGGRVIVRSRTTREEAHACYPRLGYTLAKSQHVYLKEL